MYDEIKEFTEIEDVFSIDFNLSEWSWGFGPEDNYGFIYQRSGDPDDPYIIAYKVPLFMVDMITQVRDAAVDALKIKLINIDILRSSLLSLN